MQIGDVAVIDISATTIGEDQSVGQKIPSAESKGSNKLPIMNTFVDAQ